MFNETMSPKEREEAMQRLNAEKNTMGTCVTDAMRAVFASLVLLTDDQRHVLFSFFCKHCGTYQPKEWHCRCSDDE